MKRFMTLSILVLIFGCTTTTPRPDGTDKFKWDFGQTWRLENGLQYIIKQDKTLPYVTVAIGYKVGSVHETKGITGTSHFLEHLLFKGTKNFTAQYLEDLSYLGGGENNAFTSNDATVYYFRVTKDKLVDILKLERDRMENCLFPEKDFAQEKSERAIVRDEKMRGLLNPWEDIYEKVEEQMFTKFPYQHPVIGSLEDINGVTRDQVIEYYKKHYAPNNAVLVIWGDVPSDASQKVIEIFSDAKKSEGLVPLEKNEPAQTEQRKIEFESTREKTRMLFGFKFDKTDSTVDPIASLVTTLLAGGRNARLTKRLVETEKLVPEGSVEIDYWPRRYYGTLFINITPFDDADLNKIEQVVFEELGNLKDVTEVELVKAKNITVSKFAFERESNNRMAIGVAYHSAIEMDDYLANFIDRVNKLSGQEVTRFVDTFFTKEKSTLGIAKPKAKKNGGGGGGGGNRRFQRCMCEQDQGIQTVFGDYYQVTLSNGLTLLIKQNLAAPVVTIKTFTNAGYYLEPADKAGLSKIVGEMLDEGTNDGVLLKTYDKLAEEIEDTGAELDTTSTGVTAKTLSKHFRKTLQIVRDVIMYPSFPQDRFEKIKRETLNEIDSLADFPREVVKNAFYESVYKGTPYGRPQMGFKETVEKITLDDVISHHGKYFRPDNTIIAISGAVDPLRTVLEVRRLFSEWGTPDKPLDLALPQVKKQSKEVPLVLNRAKDTQINVYMGHVGIERTNPDFFALRVAETIFGAAPAMVDRMAKTMREGEISCYEAWGVITRGADYYPSAFTVYFGFNDAKLKDKAMKTATDELKKFVKDGPTNKEVDDAKQHLSRRFFIAWDTNSGMCDYMILLKRFNLPADYHKIYTSKILSLTTKDVHDAIKRNLDPTKMTIIVAGPVGNK